MDVKQMSEEATVFLSDLSAWAVAVVPDVVIALAILAGGWWLAGRAGRGAAALVETRPQIDSTLRGVVSAVVRYAILTLVFVAALGQVGVQTTSIFAALGAVALAVGLAMQSTLANLAAGVMLIWLRPFRVGDLIEAGQTAGTVQEVGLFASELRTFDGVFLFVPNSELWNTRIANFGRLPTRMVEVMFGVGYADDIDKGLAVLRELGGSDPRVRKEPEPISFVHELGDSAVTLSLRVWVASSLYWDVRRDLTGRGKAALEAAGLSIPFPQRDVHVHERPLSRAA